MTKFSYQINGRIEVPDKFKWEIEQVIGWLTGTLEGDEKTLPLKEGCSISLTGGTVYKLEEKNPAHKGVARKKGL